MTLTLVTLAIIGSLTLTWFSRGSTATATLATPLFARPFASLRAWAGCSTSHARLPPPATTFTALSRPLRPWLAAMYCVPQASATQTLAARRSQRWTRGSGDNSDELELTLGAWRRRRLWLQRVGAGAAHTALAADDTRRRRRR